jgi:hypothetical protein
MVDPYTFKMVNYFPVVKFPSNPKCQAHTMLQVRSGLDAGSLGFSSLSLAPQTGPAVPTTPAIIGATSLPLSTPVLTTESSVAALSLQTGSGRIRITTNNPTYGFVEGAKQGNAQYGQFTINQYV